MSSPPRRGSAHVKPFCDICWGSRHSKGGEDDEGKILQQCVRCGTCFHNVCYGRLGNSEYMKRQSNLICLACRYVGKTVKVREKDPSTGKHLEFKVDRRPTECCLCNVDDGDTWPHAMHPMYDTHGNRGRQVVLKATKVKPKRLAWVHTACAWGISYYAKTAGTVYGCTIEGDYGCDDDDDGLSDDDSVNSELDRDKDRRGYRSIHHFVHQQVLSLKVNHSWLRAIREHQETFKCIFCGKHDKHPDVYRIAVPCSANDENELPQFRGAHASLGRGDTCCQGMHVGCAFWKRNDFGEPPRCRRFFYEPQRGTMIEGGSNPVPNFFCDAHAKEVRDAGTSRAASIVYAAADFRRRTSNTMMRDNTSTVTTGPGTTTTREATTAGRTKEGGNSQEAFRRPRNRDASANDETGTSRKLHASSEQVQQRKKPPPPSYERHSNAVVEHRATKASRQKSSSYEHAAAHGRQSEAAATAKRPKVCGGNDAAALTKRDKVKALSRQQSSASVTSTNEPGSPRNAAVRRHSASGPRRASKIAHDHASGGVVAVDRTKKWTMRTDAGLAAAPSARALEKDRTTRVVVKSKGRASIDGDVLRAMVADVLDTISPITNRTPDEIKRAWLGRQYHWKRQANVSSGVFNDYWGQIRREVWSRLPLPPLKTKKKSCAASQDSSAGQLEEIANAVRKSFDVATASTQQASSLSKAAPLKGTTCTGMAGATPMESNLFSDSSGLFSDEDDDVVEVFPAETHGATVLSSPSCAGTTTPADDSERRAGEIERGEKSTEQIVADIIQDVRSKMAAASKDAAVQVDCTVVLSEAKMHWERNLGLSGAGFDLIWDKATSRILEDEGKNNNSEPAATFETTTTTQTTAAESKWSFLLFGPQYDPSKLDSVQWDTYEELPLIRQFRYEKIIPTSDDVRRDNNNPGLDI